MSLVAPPKMHLQQLHSFSQNDRPPSPPLQEKFEDKYASLVAPRVAEVQAWAAAEEAEALRQHSTASTGAGGRRRQEWEALEARCAVGASARRLCLLFF